MLGQFTVVSQHEQSFGLSVEASNVKEIPEFRRNKIKYCVTRVSVLAGGDEPSWFV
jgi:hypothetical protein